MEQTEKVGRLYRKQLIENIKKGIADNPNAFLLSYTAISASQMSTLRRDLKQMGAQVFVSKNRLARVALKEAGHEAFGEDLGGQTAFVFSSADSVEISKALMKFAKEWEGLLVKAGLLDGAVLAQPDIQRLADLPSKEVLQAQLLGTIIAPLTRLAGALNAKSRELLSILKQYSEQKGEK